MLWWLSGKKNLPANAGVPGYAGLIPRLGRSPGGGNGSLFPGESHGQRSLEGYSPKGCKESDTTERLSTVSINCIVKTSKQFLLNWCSSNKLPSLTQYQAIIFIGCMDNNRSFGVSHICKCCIAGNLITFPSFALINRSHILKSIVVIIINH